MTFTLFTVLCILSHNTHAAEYDGWIKETSQRLNKADEQIAIGYDGFYIYLIGGYSDTVETSRYEYDLFSNNVTTMSGIEFYQKGYGQYYTQHDNILYMIFNTNLYFCDLTNKCDTLHTQNIGTGHNVMTTGCVTSNEDFIFVLGGGNGFSFNYAHLSILNLRTNYNTWLSGPTMIYKRSLLSCVAHPTTGKLYAIGGKNDTTTTTATIEAITIADIFNENWSIVSSLLYPSTSARAVTHSDNILVIGAHLAMNEIQVINCLNNVVTSGGFLSYGVYDTAPIIVQNVLYAFGGNNGSSMVDTWQYFDLGALINTGPPTHNPTQATITDTPTLAPFTTNVPTSAMPTTTIPTTTIPTTTIPTTTMPTTDTPTTHVFTFLPSYVPTTDTPTTHVPTTDTPTTTMPTTYIPTHIPTTLEPTYPSITTKTYGVSIRIKFQYKLDVIITINVTDTIQETINIIVTESIETNCVLSNNDYEITTNNGQQNVTIVDVTVIVCNEISEANLRVAFKNDLKTDLQTNIQENNKLSIPNDLINVIISDIIVPKNTFISTTSENFNDTELSKENSDNSFIYIFAIIGGLLVCIIVIICALCIYKFKTLHSEIENQELKKYVNRNAIKSDTSANSSNTEPGQTDMVKVQSVSIETDIIITKTVTKGCDISNMDQVTSIGSDEFVVDGDSENENQELEGIDIKYSTHSDNGTVKGDEGTYVDEFRANKHVYPTPLNTHETIGKGDANKIEGKHMFVVEEWLKNTVQLSQYKHNFIENGYETIQIIAEIKSINELVEIGIVSKQHQLVLLKEIEKLKY